MKIYLLPLVLFLTLGVACPKQEKEVIIFDRTAAVRVADRMMETPGTLESLAAFTDTITGSREITVSILSSAYLNRIPFCLMLAIAKVESNFTPLALHSNGDSYDIGIFQLNNLTFKDYEEEYLYIIPNNARCAGEYLRQLFLIHKSWELSVLSYNCGGIAKSVPGQTVRYMRAVLDTEREYMRIFYEGVVNEQD